MSRLSERAFKAFRAKARVHELYPAGGVRTDVAFLDRFAFMNSTDIFSPERTPEKLDEIARILSPAMAAFQIAGKTQERLIEIAARAIDLSLRNSFKVSNPSPRHTEPASGTSQDLRVYMEDQQIGVFVQGILAADTIIDHKAKVEKLFDFIKAGKTVKARDWRMGAISVMAKIGLLHFPYGQARTFWRAIDEGQPFFDAMAKSFDCTPVTARHLYKHYDAFLDDRWNKDNFYSMIKILDRLNYNDWPKNHQDAVAFLLTSNTARYADQSDGRAQGHHLKAWHRGTWDNGRPTWTDVFLKLVRKLEDPHNPGEPFVAGQTNYWQYFVQKNNRLFAVTNGLNDMRYDIRNKIIQPAVVLEFEKYGVDTAEHIRDVLMRAGYYTDTNIWRHETFSSTYAASSYWHSPRVAFQERFASISLTKNLDQSWGSLIQEPVTVHGVVFHSLHSADALDIEANAMEHCVWSYAARCITDRNHIFSLRTVDGQRLSTLNLVDYDLKGNKAIKIVQHRAKRNMDVPPEADIAAEMFLEKIKMGLIVPNWDEIDRIRQEYAGAKVNRDAGYDFNDPQQRERVFELYRPCLPAHLARAENFDGMIEAAGIKDFVRAVVQEHHPDKLVGYKGAGAQNDAIGPAPI